MQVYSILNLTSEEQPGMKSENPLYQIINFKYNPEQILWNPIGWEPLKLYIDPTTHIYTDVDFEPCRFLGIWSRHNGAEVYYLQERGGYLYYEWGNGNSTTSDRVFLYNQSTTRSIPPPSEAGTQLTEVGNFALISNGNQRPFKFYGNEKIINFGFFEKPEAPYPFQNNASFRSTGIFTGAHETAYSLVSSLDEEYYGITKEETGKFNYVYAISYVSETGSEGPLSDLASITFDVGTGDEGRFVNFISIPKGPDGTQSRRIYRSKRRYQGSILNGDLFFLKEINENVSEIISDHFPDDVLTDYAPGYGGRIGDLIVPIDNFTYSEIWDGRLWCGGGQAYERTVIYSERASSNIIGPPRGPETFYLSSRLDLGNGGRITSLVGFGDNLYIFRERSIDLVYKLNDGTYSFNQFSKNIGTMATNSIQVVPGVGLVFLSYDGFYAIQPGIGLGKISKKITETCRRISQASLGRSTSVYNPIEQEYWCHFPIDGETENIIGAVLHSNGEWTLRTIVNPDNRRNMLFTQLGFDGYYTIIGTKPYDDELEDGETQNIEDGSWRDIGLQVWTSFNGFGTKLTGGAAAGGAVPYGYTFATSETNSQQSSLIESNWINFETRQKKKIKSIELIMLGTGSNSVELEFAINGRYVWTSAGSKEPKYDEDKVDRLDKVYGTTGKTVAEWDVDIYSGYRHCFVSWDIDTLESGSGVIDSLRFKLTSNDLIGILGVNIIYDFVQNPRTGKND